MGRRGVKVALPAHDSDRRAAGAAGLLPRASSPRVAMTRRLGLIESRSSASSAAIR
jgi:hypothetical protein